MNIVLIKANQSDRAYFLSIRKTTMVEHLEKAGLFLSDDEHLTRIDYAFECSYIILLSNERVGTIKYREHDDKIELIQIQIHPDYQSLGLGRAVLEKIITFAISKLKFVELKVLKVNPARHLYERLGFVIVGGDEYEFHMKLMHGH